MTGPEAASHTIEELATHLRTGSFAPVYLLHGEEDFLVEEAWRLIVNQALPEPAKGFNLDFVDGGDADVPSVLALASAYPMMASHRVVVVRDADRLAGKEALLPYVAKPLTSTLLVLTVAKADFRVKFYRTLASESYHVGCRPLFEDKIPAWIHQRVRAMRKTITADACQLMVEHVGRSLRAIQNELDKMSIYVGERNEIAADDVHAIVGMTKQFNIFELQRAIARKSFPDAVEILERMLAAGEQPTNMIRMLTKYFQTSWKLAELKARRVSRDELANLLGPGTKPSHLPQYEEALRHYTPAEIERLFETLLTTDVRLKSSGCDPHLLMTLMVHRMIRPESQG